jgi:hypothetical protein
VTSDTSTHTTHRRYRTHPTNMPESRPLSSLRVCRPEVLRLFVHKLTVQVIQLR